MTELLENSPVSAGEDDVRQYLNEIRRYPRLTPEEEQELAMRCAQGDESAIRQMVNSNLRLVVSIAREYAGRGVALMDLIQEGSIGLLVAARKFDYTKDYRFSTYATKWIRQGVTRCLMNHGSAIRVPLHTAERMRKIEAVRTALRQEPGGRNPPPRRSRKSAACPRKKVAELTQLTPDICSLDVPTGDDDGTALQSLLEDAQAPQPYEEVVRGELDKTMDQLLSTLNERQQQILRLHFGMEDGNCYSLEEIGKKLSISKERVRQIERQAMDKLQKNGYQSWIGGFLE